MSSDMTKENSSGDLLRCVSCKGEVSDLRLLPCVHTVCLECLLEAGRNKAAGENMPCPKCCKEFQIPPDGLVGVQENFFIRKLQYIRNLQPETPCEFCSNKGSVDQNDPRGNTQEIPPEIPHAVVYCVECEQKICERCREAHKKVKTSRNHRFVDLGNKSEIEKLTRSIPQSYCDQHPGEVVRIFCESCKLPVCHVCFEDGHMSHEFSTIQEAGKLFRNQLSNQSQGESGFVGKINDGLSKFIEQKNKIIKDGELAERAVKSRAEDLKRVIDQHAEMLTDEIESITDKRTATIERLATGLKSRVFAMLDLTTYAGAMALKATDVEICRAFHGLSDRINELKEEPQGSTPQTSGSTSKVFNKIVFNESALEERWGVNENNIVGKILDVTQVGEKALDGTCCELSGITYLEDRIYTIQRLSKVVCVFNGRPPFDRLASEDIEIPRGKLDLHGICASAVCRYLYLIFPKEALVLKLDFSQNKSKPVIKYSNLCFHPCGISVSMSNDLLILGYEKAAISEGDNRTWFLQLHIGAELREDNLPIPLPKLCKDPIQAVLTSRRTFLVMHKHEHETFFINEVSITGELVNPVELIQYDLPMSGLVPMSCMTIDENDVLFLGECAPNVVRLDPRSNRTREPLIRERGGLKLAAICYVRSLQWIVIGSNQPNQPGFCVYSLGKPF